MSPEEFEMQAKLMAEFSKVSAKANAEARSEEIDHTTESQMLFDEMMAWDGYVQNFMRVPMAVLFEVRPAIEEVEKGAEAHANRMLAARRRAFHLEPK